MEIKRRKAQPFTVEEDHEVMELREALAASQREREQLQARLIEHQDMHKAMTLESVALYAQIGLLQARVDAAEKLIAKWRAWPYDHVHETCAADLETALASPPAAPVQAEGEK